MLNLIKFSTLFLFFSLCTQLSAQIEKGSYSIMPEISISRTQNNSSDNTDSFVSFFLSPGIFVTNNLSLNIDFGFATQNSKSTNISRRFSSISVGPRLVLMKPISEKFYIPFFVGYNYTVNSNDRNALFFVPNFSNIFLGAGVEFLVAERLALRFSLRNNFIFVEDSTDKLYQLNGFIGANLYFARVAK